MLRPTLLALAAAHVCVAAKLSNLTDITHVFLIVLENTNWLNINAQNAPYLYAKLLPQYAIALNYKTPPGNHPSNPNYIWLEAGTNFGIKDDADPSSSKLLTTTQHLSTLLNNAGISWKTYQENITGVGCPLVSSYPYECKHNPFVYFSDVNHDLDSNGLYCQQHVRPFTELAVDLANNTVARYNFITPNMCDDGHDCSFNTPDTWLSQTIPLIMGSQAYKSGGLIIITWDEGNSNGDGPIGFIVVSQFSRVNYGNIIPYTHSSTLRTLQDIFNVQPYLGDAATATNVLDLFLTDAPPSSNLTATSHSPSGTSQTGALIALSVSVMAFTATSLIAGA